MKHNKEKYRHPFVPAVIYWKSMWKKKIFASAGTQKGWRTVGSGNALPQYLPNFKNTIPVKSIFTLSISILLASDKKAKTISLNV